jgi:ATP-dependent RNA helicase RhlE
LQSKRAQRVGQHKRKKNTTLKFNEFNFNETLLEGLDAMGYDKATPIQEQAIPAILANKDLIACAQTGTGKTAAYLLPILHKIAEQQSSHIDTLIIAPTRELAIQIDQQVEAFAYFTNTSSIAVYGGGDGMAWEQQKKAITKGVDIIIATPGRLISMLGSNTADLSKLKHLVLDEADRMLDMGFSDDILRIISYLPKNRQTVLFSATMPPKIRMLANKILVNPEQINIAISKPAEGILQQAYVVYDNQKLPLLKQILKQGDYKSVIIFASTKESAKKLEIDLRQAGVQIKSFHSDLEQNVREEIMRQFKNRQLQVLIGTDILSRGIDVDGISLVINYDTQRSGRLHSPRRTYSPCGKYRYSYYIHQRKRPKEIFRYRKLNRQRNSETDFAGSVRNKPCLRAGTKAQHIRQTQRKKAIPQIEKTEQRLIRFPQKTVHLTTHK